MAKKENVGAVSAEDLSYMQERVDRLVDLYKKANIGEIIVNTANKIAVKKPGQSKEALMERAYSLVQSMLESGKFETFQYFVVTAVKIGDWNGKPISLVEKAWKEGNQAKRDELIMQGKVVTLNGKPVSKIIKTHKTEDGRNVIDDAEFTDPMDMNSIPLAADAKAEFTPGKKNGNFGLALTHRYHVDVYGEAGIVGENGKVTPTNVVLTYGKNVADPAHEDFIGAELFMRTFHKYDMRAKSYGEKTPPTFDGNSAVWGEEDPSYEFDKEVIDLGGDDIMVITLDQIEDVYKTFFKEGGKVHYDRLAMSEVTIDRVGEESDQFGRLAINIHDSTKQAGEYNIRALVPDAMLTETKFPAVPCNAMMSYIITEKDGKYDFKTKTTDKDAKSYNILVTGLRFIEGVSLDDSEKDELIKLLGED